MLLSINPIQDEMRKGNIVILPFQEENLGSASYDLTLGRWFYRETPALPGRNIYNMYDPDHVNRVWRHAEQAITHADWLKCHPDQPPLKNIGLDEELIWLAPGETILAHTNEFIGGRYEITTMMKARSSLGRNFITVCRCAGWGDVGYINRWTMEITNNSRYYHIPLVVGRRVAQLTFFKVDPVSQEDSYVAKGKYQSKLNEFELQQIWHPADMLPKMWLDREVLAMQKKENEKDS